MWPRMSDEVGVLRARVAELTSAAMPADGPHGWDTAAVHSAVQEISATRDAGQAAEAERDLEAAAKTATATKLLDALRELSAAERQRDDALAHRGATDDGAELAELLAALMPRRVPRAGEPLPVVLAEATVRAREMRDNALRVEAQDREILARAVAAEVRAAELRRHLDHRTESYTTAIGTLHERLADAERRLDNETLVAELRSAKAATLRDALLHVRADLAADGPLDRVRVLGSIDRVVAAVDKRRAPVASNPPGRLEPAGEVASGLPLGTCVTVSVVGTVADGRMDGTQIYISTSQPAIDGDLWLDDPHVSLLADRDFPHCAPVDDQPAASGSDDGHGLDLAAKDGAVDADGVGGGAVVAGGEFPGDAVEDESHAATIAHAFDRGE